MSHALQCASVDMLVLLFFPQLQQGELSGSGCEKVVALCSALQGGDIAQAQRLHADLSATEWHASNRQW